jgi:hypothetical protein
MKLNCGAQRHHYSMFNVGRSMFDRYVILQLAVGHDSESHTRSEKLQS